MQIEINKDRIRYLLALYKMSINDLLSILNKGRKRLTTAEKVDNDTIDISLLKRIDKVFDKGLNFYQDFSPLNQNGNSSVFFRKSEFGTDLNRESIRIVNQFENLKQALDAYNILSHLHIRTNIDHCDIKDNPHTVALKARTTFHPGKITKSRNFLIEFIGKCAENGIFVFEYVETWNKKERTNIDGFYLQPDMIVLKRHRHYKREIFTLAHELGHCFLREEEIEPLDIADTSRQKRQNAVERWCNDFAFSFIMGDLVRDFSNLNNVNSSNDYYFEYISNLSLQTHISRLALYTRLYLDNKMSFSDYQNVRDGLADMYKAKQEKERANNEGKKNGTTPKPIISPLFLKTMQHAYFKGIINESVFCSRLKINSDNFEKVLWQ